MPVQQFADVAKIALVRRAWRISRRRWMAAAVCPHVRSMPGWRMLERRLAPPWPVAPVRLMRSTPPDSLSRCRS